MLQLCREKKDLEFKCRVQRKLRFTLHLHTAQYTAPRPNRGHQPFHKPRRERFQLSSIRRTLSLQSCLSCALTLSHHHTLQVPTANASSRLQPPSEGPPACRPPHDSLGPAQHAFCRKEACRCPGGWCSCPCSHRASPSSISRWPPSAYDRGRERSLGAEPRQMGRGSSWRP